MGSGLENRSETEAGQTSDVTGRSEENAFDERTEMVNGFMPKCMLQILGASGF